MKVGLFLLLIVVIIMGAFFAINMRELPEAASVENVRAVLADELVILREMAEDSVNASHPSDFEILEAALENPEDLQEVLDLSLNDEIDLGARAAEIENVAVKGISLKHSYGRHSNRISWHLKGEDGAFDGWAMTGKRAKINKPRVNRVINSNGNYIHYEEVVTKTSEFDVRLLLVLDLDELETQFEAMKSTSATQEINPAPAPAPAQ